jgi:zinc protease
VAVPKVEFEHYELPNGLDVILHVDRKLPIVHVNQWFHVGSKNERRGRTGFAHLFEHMMFQGSKHASEEYFVYAERAGANLQEGGVNGTTSNDRTNYFITAPAGKLEYLLWLESDRLATLLDAVDEAKFRNQVDVVRNERRQGLENTPYGRWHKLLLENLYPAEHPYSWTVIGSHEDLAASSLEDVKDFFRTYYSPNNLSLVIAGDFDPAEARRLVEKYFGPIPPGPALDRPERARAHLASEKVVDAFDRVPQERVYMVWPIPEAFHPDEAPLDLAALVLADGLSSRLQKVLVYDRQLASNVQAFAWTMELGGQFLVIATARPGVKLEQVEEVVTAEVARLAKEGPTAEELQRAKVKQQHNFVSGLERVGGFGGKSDLLNFYNTFFGNPGMFAADVERYQAVTAPAVRSVVGRWLDTGERLLIRFHPETSQRAEVEPVDRAAEPALGEDRPFRAPEVQTTTLANGMQLLVVERHELPKVAVTLVTRAGAAADPAGREGTAHLAMQVIDRGTAERDALRLEEELGNLGASLQTFAGREHSTLSLDLLSATLPQAMEVLADITLRPQFPEAEVARERQLQLDALGQESRNANGLAARIRPMLSFGPDHPYGRPARGLPGTMSAISRDDLVRYHADWWRPGSSALVFVGDVTLDQARRLAEQHFGGWSGGAAPAVAVPEPRPAQAGRIYLVDRPDAAQTVVSQSLLGVDRKHEDYYALLLADAVWGGGGFGNRLNLNLREDKGYAYGAFSFQQPFSRGALWTAQAGVQTDKTKESVVEFLRELEGLHGERPVTDEELAVAKLKRIRGYSQQFETPSRIAGELAELWQLGLPMSDLQRDPEATAAATLAEVHAAARQYALPDRSILLLVGDRAKIEPGLRELGAGEIVVLDAEGKPAG